MKLIHLLSDPGIHLPKDTSIVLAQKPARLPYGIDAAASAIHSRFGLPLADHCLFLFISQNLSRIKVIFCQEGGIWMVSRKLPSPVSDWPLSTSESDFILIPAGSFPSPASS